MSNYRVLNLVVEAHESGYSPDHEWEEAYYELLCNGIPLARKEDPGADYDEERLMDDAAVDMLKGLLNND